MRAAAEQALAIGWHAEVFARTKRMKSLGEYCDRRTDEERADEGGAKVLALFRRIWQKQETGDGTG
jgi:hypothetical protein